QGLGRGPLISLPDLDVDIRLAAERVGRDERGRVARDPKPQVGRVEGYVSTWRLDPDGYVCLEPRPREDHQSFDRWREWGRVGPAPPDGPANFVSRLGVERNKSQEDAHVHAQRELGARDRRA